MKALWRDAIETVVSFENGSVRTTVRMKALWRNEIVTVVSAKNGKVQIARACGLRWVRLGELSKVPA